MRRDGDADYTPAMETEEIIKHAQELAEECDRAAETLDPNSATYGTIAGARSFLERFAGSRSHFYKDACKIMSARPVAAILRSFVRSLERGLVQGIDPKREAQVEVVSDILEQAQALLANNRVHPAGPAVLIGAALEEFLRTWIEREGIRVTGKPGLDNYSTALVKNGDLKRQDKKDITGWAGLRNHAAHGEWDDVPKDAVQIMLQGVNLFLRTHGGQ